MSGSTRSCAFAMRSLSRTPTFMAGFAVDALQESFGDKIVRVIRHHRLAFVLVLTYLLVRLLLLSLFHI